MGITYLFDLINEFSDEQKEEITKYIIEVQKQEKGEIGNSFCYPLIEGDNFVGDTIPDLEYIDWHEYKENMSRLSRKFPKILFILKVCHESTVSQFGDIEKNYFQNGKSLRIKGRMMAIWEKEFIPERMKDKKLKKKEYDMSKVVFLGK